MVVVVVIVCVYTQMAQFFYDIIANRLGENYVVNSAKKKNTKFVFPHCARGVGWASLLVFSNR